MRALIITILTIVVPLAGIAQAQPDGDKVNAKHYFFEGRTLMAQERYEDACRAFERSLALSMLSSTQLNLALCHEKLGKLATAWRQYREAAILADRDNKQERAHIAREYAAALEPRVPRLLITLAAPGTISELAVHHNGMAITAKLGSSEYVDPGVHEVVATAPNHDTFLITVNIGAGEARTVEIPPLAPIAPKLLPEPTESAAGPEPSPDIPSQTEPLPASATAASATAASATAASAAASATALPPSAKQTNTRRIVAVTTGAIGLATVGVGIGVGASAQSVWNQAFDSDECNRDTKICSAAGQAQTDTARMRARISDILLGAGAILTATGAILYLTATKRDQKQTQAHAVPFTTPTSAGITLIGQF